MKRSALAAAGLGLLVVFAGPAWAQEDTPAMPDLVGSWKGEKTVYYLEGERRSISELEITKQDGFHFSGTRSWQQTEEDKAPLGQVGGEHVRRASEPILGLVDFDGATLHIVEHDDWGHFRGRLVDSDTIQLIYVESGPNAAVYRVTLKRER